MLENTTYPLDLEFLPPKQSLKNDDFSEILLKARIELAELKGATGQMHNPLLLTSPLLVRESVESSGIENINTTVANVLENQLLAKSEQSKPDKEVLRYREALFYGINNLKEISISSRMILGVHEKLMEKRGGEYRREQNQIVNSSTGEVIFVPPLQVRIPELIANWERYVNENKDLDPLIRAAIAHQQFESIHPFLDGNGRTGRILMVLQLVQDSIIDLPILFISGYINKNRSEYYRLLREVTYTGEWKSYINFMLQGFFLQARDTKETLNKVVILHKEIKNLIKDKHSKIYSADLLEAFFSYPIVTSTKLSSELNIHRDTASKYLSELTESGILDSIKAGRNNFYINKKLLDLL